MPPRAPLDYDVSVTAAKRRRARLRGMSGAVETSTKTCQWPGCKAHGLYRAPMAPDRLSEYRWFCLEHVREYNAGWNFFADVTEEEIDHLIRRATTWERPTWRLGDAARPGQRLHPHAEGRAWERWGIADPLDLLGENATLRPEDGADRARTRRRLTRAEQTAMDTLGLPHQVTRRCEVRARYRALVKDLHPDINGGTQPDAERLTRVLRAWDLLKASPNFED